jgi:hypothetical protein
MAQQIMDMIARMGGADGIAAMAAKVGITPEQAEQAVAALVPAVTGGMAKQAQAGNGSLVDQLAGMAAAAGDGAVAHGNEILGNIFGSPDVSNAVATQAAGKTGLDISAIAALMPMVATMAASALGNGTGTVAAPAQGGLAGGLAGMLGGLLGGGAGAQGGAAGALMNMIDTNKDGNPLDEIMGMASAFMKR